MSGEAEASRASVTSVLASTFSDSEGSRAPVHAHRHQREYSKEKHPFRRNKNNFLTESKSKY